MKEAFVAALLALVVRKNGRAGALQERGFGGGDLDDLPLWKEIQKQVKNLRRELDLGSGERPHGEELSHANNWSPVVTC